MGFSGPILPNDDIYSRREIQINALERGEILKYKPFYHFSVSLIEAIKNPYSTHGAR